PPRNSLARSWSLLPRPGALSRLNRPVRFPGRSRQRGARTSSRDWPAAHRERPARPAPVAASWSPDFDYNSPRRIARTRSPGEEDRRARRREDGAQEEHVGGTLDDTALDLLFRQ